MTKQEQDQSKCHIFFAFHVLLENSYTKSVGFSTTLILEKA